MTDTRPSLGVVDWNEAYDVCRERDRPLRVMDSDGSVTQIFPSGHGRSCSSDKHDLFILPPND